MTPPHWIVPCNECGTVTVVLAGKGRPPKLCASCRQAPILRQLATYDIKDQVADSLLHADDPWLYPSTSRRLQDLLATRTAVGLHAQNRDILARVNDQPARLSSSSTVFEPNTPDEIVKEFTHNDEELERLKDRQREIRAQHTFSLSSRVYQAVTAEVRGMPEES